MKRLILNMKSILVPTDFSECAYHALEYAAFLAKKRLGKLNIVTTGRNC